jgi:L-ribulose-5-phosphate 3-epimerase
MAIDRRKFLVHAGALTVAAGVLRAPLEAAPAASAPKYRLSLGQWSFHRALFAKKLDNLDFAATAKRDFGFEGVDYVNQFFRDKADDKAYLAEMKKRATDAGVESDLVLVDVDGLLGDPDQTSRQAAIDVHKQWVEAAKLLGCRGIRVNAHGKGTPDEQRKQTAEGVRTLAEFAAPLGIDILIENHGGVSSDGAWLAALVKEVGHPGVGTLPDFGNWSLADGTWYDRYKGVAELMPQAKAVSVKAHAFDAQGNETQTDFAKMLKIVIDGGYKGEFLEIEYEGEALSEADGIRATKKLLEKTLAAL